MTAGFETETYRLQRKPSLRTLITTRTEEGNQNASLDHSYENHYKMAKDSNFVPFADLLQADKEICDKEQKNLKDIVTVEKEAHQNGSTQKEAEVGKQKMIEAEETSNNTRRTFQRRSSMPAGVSGSLPARRPSLLAALSASVRAVQGLDDEEDKGQELCDTAKDKDKKTSNTHRKFHRRSSMPGRVSGSQPARRPSLLATFRSASMRAVQGLVDEEDNGQELYDKAKDKAEEECWKDAIILYNKALVKQRSFYGSNSVVCATTLNNVGSALLRYGESYMALTALEEALHIRQTKLGTGAQEVAETTTNIWLALRDFKSKNEDSRRDACDVSVVDFAQVNSGLSGLSLGDTRVDKS